MATDFVTYFFSTCANNNRPSKQCSCNNGKLFHVVGPQKAL